MVTEWIFSLDGLTSAHLKSLTYLIACLFLQQLLFPDDHKSTEQGQNDPVTRVSEHDSKQERECNDRV